MPSLPKEENTLMKIGVMNTVFVLHPYRATYWPERSILIVTDLHLGKIQHFRNHGIYLPKDALLDNYERLSGLLLEFQPTDLLMLGDLFHSEYNQDWQNFCVLRHTFSHIRFLLIPGNHDIIDNDLFFRNDVQLLPDGLSVAGFHFSHYPAELPGLYHISGHLHPAIRLNGSGLQSLTLPAFYFGAHQALLPSFGIFTGSSLIRPSPGDQVIAVFDDSLISIDTNS